MAGECHKQTNVGCWTLTLEAERLHRDVRLAADDLRRARIVQVAVSVRAVGPLVSPEQRGVWTKLSPDLNSGRSILQEMRRGQD